MRTIEHAHEVLALADALPRSGQHFPDASARREVEKNRHKAENLLPILAAAAERPRPASNAGLMRSGLAGPVHTLRRRRREAAGAPVVRFYSAAMATLERAGWARWESVAPLAE